MIAKYNAAGNCLEELPGIAKPLRYQEWLTCVEKDKIFNCADEEGNAIIEYQNHLSSLRHHQCDEICMKQWKDGDLLTQDIDYKLHKVCRTYYESCEIGSSCDRCLLVAFPLPVKSEDDLWKEFLAIVASIHSRFGSNIVKFGFKKASDILLQESAELKQKYSLTKK